MSEVAHMVNRAHKVLLRTWMEDEEATLREVSVADALRKFDEFNRGRYHPDFYMEVLYQPNQEFQLHFAVRCYPLLTSYGTFADALVYLQ